MNLLLFLIPVALVTLSLYQPCETQLMIPEMAMKAAKTLFKALPAVQKFLKKKPGKEGFGAQIKIFNKLEQLSDNLNMLKEDILNKITRTLRSKLIHKTDELFKYIEDVQISYNSLQNINKQKHHSKNDILEFSKVNTGYGLHELPAVLQKMHTALIGKDFNGESILTIITESSHEYDTACIRRQSVQQLLAELYKIVVQNDIKGWIVKQFSLTAIHHYSDENDDSDIQSKVENERELHLERLTKTFNEVKNYMKIASRKFWNCGPRTNEKDVTYSKLQVFQGFFMYETDTTLNRDGMTLGLFRTLYNSVTSQCEDLVDERYRCNSAVCKAQPEDRRCNHLRDCSYIDNNIQVCHSPPGSDRRYDWMRIIDTEDKYGDYNEKCENTQGMVGMAGFSICFCNCENEVQQSVRYFSLKEVTSDVQQHKVITGIRLQKVGYVYHIQIQQGVLSSGGTIKGPVEWKPIKEITAKQLMSKKISKYTYFKYDSQEGPLRYEEWTEFYKNDLVYTVTYKQNTVYLDDIEAPPGSVLTGLRFKHANDALRLEIRVTRFDLPTGLLLNQYSDWKFNRKTIHERNEARSKSNDDPQKCTNPNIYSQPDEYVRFRLSDLRKDVSQNTVPYIDLETVIPKSENPLPLVGAGIYYKHDDQHAGFLSLKAIHFDLTSGI